MFSVFESWMVTEYLAQGLDKSSLSLDSMFGIMTTLNSIVAILSGVVGEGLVSATGSKVSPFIAAVLCLSIAFMLILKYWVSHPCIPYERLGYSKIVNRTRVKITATELALKSKKFQSSHLSVYYKVSRHTFRGQSLK